MKNVKRCLLATVLSLSLSSGFVSAALLPLGFGLALLTGVSASSLILPIIASSVVVGTALTWLTVGGSPNQSASSAPIMVQLDPKTPVATPPGWTPPASGQVQPTPPSSVSSQMLYGRNGMDSPFYPHSFSTPAAACNALAALGSSFWGFTPASNSVSGGEFSYRCWAYNSSGAGTSVAMDQSQSCPAGYSLSGGTCALSDASVVKKPADGRCFIVRSGNSFAADVNDPDCSAGLPAEFSLGTNTVSWMGRGAGDGGGSVVIDGATGEATIQNNVQNVDATTTTVTIRTSAPDPNAAPGEGVKVKGITQETKAGVGSGASNVPVSQIRLDLPTDYNRETTQQAIKSGVDQLNNSLNPAGVDTSLSTPRAQYDAAVEAHKGKLQALIDNPLNSHGIAFSFSPIIPASSCFEPAWSIAGRTVNFTWCDKISILKELLAWVFFILTGFGIYNMVTRET